jgi:hypothetical protein
MSLLGKLTRLMGPKGAAGAVDPNASQPVFYSALQEALRGHPMESGTGADWLSQMFEPERVVKSAMRDTATNKPMIDQFGQPMIETRTVPRSIKLKEVKPQEIKWSGIEDYLNEMRDKPVTRDQLVDFMEGGSGGSTASNRGRGTSKYQVDDYSVRSNGDGESEEDWLERYSDRISDRQQQLIDEYLDENSYEWSPRFDVIEEEAGSFPDRDEVARLLSQYERTANQNDALANRAGHAQTLFAGDLMASHPPQMRTVNTPQDYFLNELRYNRERAIPLQQQLQYVDSMLARDPDTPDLFTGLRDEELLADELEPRRNVYRVRIVDSDGDELEALDDIFDSEREALRYAERNADLSDYESNARDAQLERMQSNNEYYDDAVEAIQDRYPRSEEGGVEYQDYTIPGGENYDELFLNLPDEFTNARGKTYRQPHWSNQSDEGTRVAHVRYKDRETYVPDPSYVPPEPPTPNPDNQRLLSEAEDQYRRVLAAATHRLNVAREANPGVSDVSLMQGDNQLMLFNQTLESLTEQVKSLKSNANPPARLDSRPQIKRRVLAMEENQSDFHQKGRDQGYSRELTPEEDARFTDLRDLIRSAEDESMRARDLSYESDKAVREHTYRNRPDNRYSPDHYGWKIRQQELMEDSRRKLGAAVEAANQMQKLKDEYHKLQSLSDGVPDAPFSSNVWAGMSAKRMLRMAADENYDQFAWPVNVSNGSVGDHQGNYFYDKIFGAEVAKLAKKAGAEVKERKGPERGKNGGTVDWRYVEMTPEFKEFLKKGLPLFMWPLFAGGAASTGLLGRGGPKKDEA